MYAGMSESITKVEYWNTKKLCEVFNTDGAEIVRLELDLNPSHLGQVLSGKRKSHKGWKNAS